MFQTLDEVKEYCNSLSSQYGMSDADLIGVSGFSSAEIRGIEEQFHVEFHPSFKAVLERIRLDKTQFGTAFFFSGAGQLDYLRHYNLLKPDNLFDLPFVNIGRTEVHYFLMDNRDGVIYAMSFDDPDLLEKIAGSFEELLLTLASLIYAEHHDTWADILFEGQLEHEHKNVFSKDDLRAIVSKLGLPCGEMFTIQDSVVTQVTMRIRHCFWETFISQGA